MTHAETILEKLTDWKPAGPGPHSLSVILAPPGTTAIISAAQTDSLSVLLNELSVATGSTGDCPAAELTQRAVATANRVTGLVEPLKVYEVDSHQSKALLRSEKPSERGGKLFYYELTLTGRHNANLKRFQVAKSGGNREAVPFALTHESVAKVVEEVVG